jgi:hypothetical protein
MKDAVGNDYQRPRDVVGPNKYAFTTHADSAFDVCFENIIPDSKQESNSQSGGLKLTVDKTYTMEVIRQQGMLS